MTRADDHWLPTASLDALRARAQLLRQLRAFMDQRGILEVETPALSHCGNTDPQLHSLGCHSSDPAHSPQGWLHTSPEFAMKRLLAAGSGPIWQLARVFRGGESGRLHNPEFSLVEWYRPGFSLRQLMDEVGQLVNHLLPESRPVEFLRYQDAFARLDCDPLQADAGTLERKAGELGLTQPGELPQMHRNQWLDLLFSLAIQPQLGRRHLTFLHHYPADQAALARLDPSDQRWALRFELFVDGIELANGYDELLDADELQRRITRELNMRQAAGLASIPADQRLIAAMQAGLPACSGVALGLDRLVMCALGADHIEQVIPFPSALA